MKGFNGKTLILILLGILAILYFALDKPVEKTAEEIEIENIEKHFSSWDGSHIELTRTIKQNLNDPDSYEHVSTSYKVAGDSVFVYMDYRANNSFGAKVLGSIVGITDKKTGKVIDWVEQE